MSKLLPWESRQSRILVIGDLILDEYLDGLVNRISPEAPVPIHLVKKSHQTAGGAANVARNVQRVGGECLLFGIAGLDSAGDSLKEILQRDGIATSRIIADEGRPTTRKTRVTSNHQQLVRIDWEEVEPIAAGVQAKLLTMAASSEFDAILVSDYGKGCLNRDFILALRELGQSRSVPVIVDPKGLDYSIYEGADLVTPNWKEACEAIGATTSTGDSPEYIAEQIAQRFKIKNVLVTLGAEGMLGFSEAREVIRLPAKAREVFDVSGAGDTVVAIMTLGLASGLSLEEAMEFANTAAGLVVEKWGTQPVAKQELLNALAVEAPPRAGATWQRTAGKISALPELKQQLLVQKQQKSKVVFTNGCFDLLHAGHLSYLEEARSLGGCLVVGVNSDRSVRQLKGASRPIVPAVQRMKLLAGLACVDFVVEFDESTPQQLIETLGPDILVKGADYEISEIVGAEHVLKNGGAVERLTFVEGLSTSQIVKQIQGGLSPQID